MVKRVGRPDYVPDRAAITPREAIDAKVNDILVSAGGRGVKSPPFSLVQWSHCVLGFVAKGNKVEASEVEKEKESVVKPGELKSNFLKMAKY
ncbi:MAG: hypothetical protein JWO30_43 [Fibrobacteres bacterium]|nr:hypothetical protein [Fibrobacterota bacterium]